MLTPQEVSERAFQKASFGGYNMAQVDEFLDILTADYTSLYNENAVLKSKMKVLVDKVEEYRSTEEAMRKALMTAQRMADELVREAEQKKAEILRATEEEASQRKAVLAQELAAEEYRLEQAQQNTAAFVSLVRPLYAKQGEYLDQLQDLCPPQAAPASDPVEETVSEIDDNVQRLLARAMVDATAENLQARREEEPQDLSDTAEFDPRAHAARAAEEDGPDDEKGDGPDDEDDSFAAQGSRIDFGELQFGKDYEIT